LALRVGPETPVVDGMASHLPWFAGDVDRLSGNCGNVFINCVSVRGTTNSELERTRGIRLFN
jgi:hypothetical protein